MPKDKRLNSLSLDRAMASPYSRGSNSADPEIDIMDEEKQWDDTLCPICMDHPHNAVLLLCSSRQTGCRAFVCDTSYRHSNCLDQLLRSNGTRPLACPLCRGSVSGWEVVGPARDLMNSKTRSCSLETCEFSGTYADLRKHARADHPSGRPFEASPSRQAGWTELERRLDMEDALAYQSHMDFEEPELWDEWGTDGLFDLPGGISDIEDGLLEEIFGGGLSFSYTSSSYTSFSYTDEEDVDSDSSVSRLDSEENGMSRSRSHREADVRSRSGYHRGSSSSARRESYSRQNENLTTSGAGYARGNVRSSYRGEHRQQQPSSRGGSGVDRVRSGLHVRSDGRSSSSSSRRHLSGSSQHFSGSSRQHLSGGSSSSSRRHLSGGSSSSSRRHLSGSSRQQSRGE